MASTLKKKPNGKNQSGSVLALLLVSCSA
uniref:Uncharacterized protein n=1 Tax=Anguilla anguilla TaxID=7936 RepID=A0A0E9SFN0_ANGAN